MKKNSIPKLELVFLLLLTGMCPQAHATDDGRNASPQKTYAVDLTLGSATVLTFTEAVTSQTGVLFSYESALSQMPLGDVSVHETAAPLEHILEKVFKGRGFRYKVVDRIVVLTYDTDSARSQLVLVTGRVKDGSGMPLVGASVVVKDTMRGVSAGAEGNYRIFADPEATLVFSYIGYADREERIGTRSAIDVVLEEYEAVLEDVVNYTNIGAVFRSAAALGIDAVLVTPSCHDPLYRRAARVSMGTVFQVPWTRIGSVRDWATEGVPLLRSLGFATAALALADDAIYLHDARLRDCERLALVLGTEGDGLAASTIAASDYTVKIPMDHDVDSLNVAAASAVAFWELRR